VRLCLWSLCADGVGVSRVREGVAASPQISGQKSNYTAIGRWFSKCVFVLFCFICVVCVCMCVCMCVCVCVVVVPVVIHTYVRACTR